ncbi:NAD-dependent epimerase/dehydratase [Macrophomina phaseolina MS6]|uniref:NAD-dependent epimerase/dehydratase n=1 Tax=Macrophomina phaseolina (strain MS6) TaxID=1126212 RepID=K2QIQ2_MACPH|nr:NAD-dependent epimerase/dehydratase [Macrophomina phaseolina MS6]
MKKSLRIGVIGPTGFIGSHVCVELIQRGHHVIGMSRNPEAIGSHEKYTPRKTDVDAESIDQLAEAFKGLDVLINAWGPHTCHFWKSLARLFWQPKCRSYRISCRSAGQEAFTFPGGAPSNALPRRQTFGWLTAVASPTVKHTLLTWRTASVILEIFGADIGMPALQPGKERKQKKPKVSSSRLRIASVKATMQRTLFSGPGPASCFSTATPPFAGPSFPRPPCFALGKGLESTRLWKTIYHWKVIRWMEGIWTDAFVASR